jgi:hypothetical protein
MSTTAVLPQSPPVITSPCLESHLFFTPTPPAKARAKLSSYPRSSLTSPEATPTPMRSDEKRRNGFSGRIPDQTITSQLPYTPSRLTLIEARPTLLPHGRSQRTERPKPVGGTSSLSWRLSNFNCTSNLISPKKSLAAHR